MEDYFSEKNFNLDPETRILRCKDVYWRLGSAVIADESIPSIIENCTLKSDYVWRFIAYKVMNVSSTTCHPISITYFLELRSGLLIDWHAYPDKVDNTCVYVLPTILTDKWNAMFSGKEYQPLAKERQISFEAYTALISSHRQNNELMVRIGLEEMVFSPSEGELIESHFHSTLYHFKSQSGKNNSMIYAQFNGDGKIILINKNKVNCQGDCKYEPESHENCSGHAYLHSDGRIETTEDTHQSKPLNNEHNCKAKIFSMVRTTYAWSPPYFELLKNQWESMGGSVSNDLFEFDDGW